MKLALFAFLMLLLTPSCQPADDPKTVGDEWTDGQARFLLSVTEGTASAPFVAELLIANESDSSISFPTPLVMPGTGDTNGSNIRVFDQRGKQLAIRGIHVDSWPRRTTEIPANSSQSWRFDLDRSFPLMALPGEYAVELWYFSDTSDLATWKGRVSMNRVEVVRQQALRKRADDK
jgi:hypothetical protein